MKIFNKIIFSFMVVTIIILTGCFSEDNSDEDEKSNELEIGEIILIQNNVSGFVAYRYDYFTVVFDSKNIYKFHIIELGSGIKENIDNDLSNEQADTIFNNLTLPHTVINVFSVKFSYDTTNPTENKTDKAE